MDEVICDTNQAMLDYHNNKYGTEFKKEQITTWSLETLYGYSSEEMSRFLDDFFSSPLHTSAAPIIGAVEGIERLKDHELVVISARPEHIRDITEKWIMRHFPNIFSHIHLLGHADALGGMEKSKGELAVELGIDIFLEDSLGNAKNIVTQGIPVILFDRPWNQESLPENVYRADSWKHALEHIESLFGIGKK